MPTSAAPQAIHDRRELRKNARRDAILSAGRKVFSRSGYDGSTMADIAKEAGVAAGTVYLYFASKIDLFAALNAELYKIINRSLRDAHAPPDLVGGTRARVSSVFEACSQHRDLVRLVFLNPDPRTEVARRMTSADEERLQPLADLFRTGMANGFVREEDPFLLARMVSSVVTMGLHQCFVLGDGGRRRVYETIVSDMIVGGLSPD